MTAKFRVRPHGGPYGIWYKIEERKFFIWWNVCEYFESRSAAELEIAKMQKKESGK